ncbi:MAG: sigma-54 dependent transcriptional regulator, partial [Gemmatimonadota bacterium]
MGKILIVDDEASVRSSFARLVGAAGHTGVTASRAEEALAMLESENPDLVVMDIRMPGVSGLEAFREIRLRHPRPPVIIMTGHGTTDYAIEATKLGAFDYQLKPFDPQVMLDLIGRALEGVRLMQGAVVMGPEAGPDSGDALIGHSPGMQEVYKAIGRVAPTEATVLIRGETGTGKELVARAIYQHSRRSQAPLLAVNCVAIPETLLESELFGYEKGAFTGAAARRVGKFEQAHGGTLFLDEIGDIPLSVQAKILRVLQERSFERVGGNARIDVDVRVLTATNRDLEKAISEGKFREDLYHRLDVVTIELPSLRQRRDDIPELVSYFLTRLARELKADRPPLAPDALEVLCEHSWPGNVRELSHCIQRLLIFTQGQALQRGDVRRALERSRGSAGGDAVSAAESLRQLARDFLASDSGGSPHREFLDLVDRILVAEALHMTSGNQTHAARLLGLSRPTLQAK